ncbi:MAG: trypsin-like peptidase domain-containing protein [Hyphomicrobiaceae bacterium]|nr:trypsin-like peptidase domain-containing protein [Hyphomicrobiaceae bacterium]
MPICERDARGHTQGHGSALLVEYSGSNFLVTASHVLAPIREGRRLYFPAATHQERTVVGPCLVTKGQNGSVDERDVAVVRLLGNGQPPYPEVDKACLPFANLKPHSARRSSMVYFATGFPATRTKTHVKRQRVEVEPFGHRVPSIDEARYASLGLDPRMSIAMQFDVKSVMVATGQRQRAADPHGMSGSPVWELYDHAGPNDLRSCVAGILIEHRPKDKVLIATDISVAIDMIKALATEAANTAQAIPPKIAGP